MIISLKGFTGFAGFRMGATDGEIGIIKEIYFDDQTWTVRYLIVKQVYQTTRAGNIANHDLGRFAGGHFHRSCLIAAA